MLACEWGAHTAPSVQAGARSRGSKRSAGGAHTGFSSQQARVHPSCPTASSRHSAGPTTAGARATCWNTGTEGLVQDAHRTKADSGSGLRYQAASEPNPEPGLCSEHRHTGKIELSHPSPQTSSADRLPST